MKFAKLLVLKGITNTVLLTGGIDKFTSYFRELVKGNDVPYIPVKVSTKKKVLSRHKNYQKKPKKDSKLRKSKLPKKDLLRTQKIS